MIYLYAIMARSSLRLPEFNGLQDYPIEKRSVGELDLVISRCDELDKNPTSEILWKHEGVVETLMKDQCVLPVRYGTCLSNDEELIRLVRAHKVSFHEDLERLDGCVEVSLRIIDPTWKSVRKQDRLLPSSSQKPSGGVDYLKDRIRNMSASKDQQEQVTARIKEVHNKLITHSLEGIFEVRTFPLFMTKSAYLLQKDELHLFQEQLGRLRSLHKEYKFVCTGPWPPYSFVRSITIN